MRMTVNNSKRPLTGNGEQSSSPIASGQEAVVWEQYLGIGERLESGRDVAMKSAYWKPVHVSWWLDRLHDVPARARTDRFSIVYRLYSTWDGPVRYVGRSDQPFGRASGHYSKIWFDGIHEELDARIVWVDFCYIKGRGRYRGSYEEECRRYHYDEPDLNTNHPAKLHESWGCPVCGC